MFGLSFNAPIFGKQWAWIVVDDFLCDVVTKPRFTFFFLLLCRLFQMGGTRVACIGQWWTAKQQENLLLSFCVQKVIRWFVHQVNWWMIWHQGSTQILHGLCCLSLLRNIIELTWKLLRNSPNGFNRKGAEISSPWNGYYLLAFDNPIWIVTSLKWDV